MQKSHISFSHARSFPISLVPPDFGRRVREVRRRLRWTQAKLAVRSGLDRATIVRLERGNRKPNADTVFRLESALDMYPDRFVPGWQEWMPIGESEPGARSRERRRSLGLTLEQVATMAGVSAATLSRFEREERLVPSLLRYERSELGGVWAYPISERLATALDFASLEEHLAYCDGD